MSDATASRSYYEAYARKNRATGRGSDAVFVERGALRALGGDEDEALGGASGAGSGRRPVLLPTEQRMVDRDEYTAFLEDQLKRVSEMVVALDAKEAAILETGSLSEKRVRNGLS